MIIGRQKLYNLSNLLNNSIMTKSSLGESTIIQNRNKSQNSSSILDNELNIIPEGSNSYNKGLKNINNHNLGQMTKIHIINSQKNSLKAS